MKRLLLLLSFLALTVPAHAQISRLDGIIFGNSGRPQPNAVISICTQPATTFLQPSPPPCSPLATLYTDSTGSTACNGSNGCSNPITADGLGNFHYYANNTVKYTYQVYGAGITTYVQVDQQLPGGGSAGGCSPVGPLDGVIFNNPLGSCADSSKFTTNASAQVDINSGGTFQIESPLDPTNNFTFGQGHQWFIHSNSADYDGSTNDGFTAYVNDASTPPQISGALTATNVTVSGGLLTVTASGASTLFNTPSLYAYFTGFTNATFLNGQIVQIANADTTSLRAVGTAFSDYSSTADTGTVELQPSSNPHPFYSGIGCSLGGDCVAFDSDSQHFGENPQAHSTTDYLAEAYGDGPEFGWGFRAREHLFVQVESAQVIAESNGTFNNEHQYAMKVGNPNATPFWWVDQIGDSFSREGFTNIASSSVGSCSLSVGLSDCTPSLATYLGPPASEIINIKICATGGTYDTFDWAEDNGNPSCASQHMLPTISGIPIADDVSITWGSQTGHTVGATAAIAVTVNFGTQLAVTGGTYLSSQALPQPGAPAVTPSPTGATSWEYAVSQSWNGVTTQVSSNTTITNGPANLNGSNFNNVAVTSSNGNPVIECTVYRTFAGGTPSTLGIIAGPSATICGTTLSDTGLAGDSSTPPSTNLTGHTTLGDGYLVFPAGVSWNVPQMTGSGPLCVSGGVISFTNHSCGGGGSGTVTNIATTGPLSGGPITTTGTLSCPTCVTSSSPGAGIAHFAGSTQAVTSSAVNLAGGSTEVINILPAANLPPTLVYTGQANTYSSAKTQTFGASTTAAASFNLPTGTAPTSPNSGDFWNASGVIDYFDGANTNSLVRIQGAVVNGHCPQFSGTAGILTDTGAVCGSGGSSLFASWQFASNAAITGTGQYFQLVAGTGLTPTYSGSGTSGSPFIGTIALTNSAITIAGTSVSLGGSTSSFPNPGAIGGGTPGTAAFTSISATLQFTSSLATGTAPFSIASTTVVPNLNVGQLLGGTWAIPGTVGSGTPNTGAFTNLAASGAVTGAGFTNYLASPPSIGTGSPGIGSFTTLTSNSTTILNSTTIPASSTLTVTKGSGTAALGTSSIAPGACATTITVAISGVNTSDNILLDFASNPTGVTGYGPSGQIVSIYKWPTAGNINIAVCNSVNNSGSISPGSMNVNYRVPR